MISPILTVIGLLVTTYGGNAAISPTAKFTHQELLSSTLFLSNDSLRLKLDWSCQAAFQKVESVVYDQKRNCIYVSNGKDYGVGQDGFISQVSMKGELMDLKWTQNLNRPTGMAIDGNYLYVADVNALLVIDLNSASVVDRIEVPIQYGINDVAISDNGNVLVTASAIHAVLTLTEQGLEIWAQDEDLLQWANGIQALPHEVLVGGEHLVRLDVETGKKRQLDTEPRVRDFEGVSRIDAQTILASTVENSALYLIENGMSRLLLQPDGYFGDLEFIVESRNLIVAQGNHQKKSYTLTCYTLE